MVKFQVACNGFDEGILQGGFAEHGVELMQAVANLIHCLFFFSQ